MATYDEMLSFSRFYNLLANRVKCCNELLGCKYENAPNNAVRLSYSKGEYRVRAYDADIASFKVWDLDGCVTAYVHVDHWADCLWHLSRNNRIAVV